MQYHAIIPCTTRIYSLLIRSLVHRKQLAEFLLMPMQNAKIQPSQGHGAIGFTPWYRNDTGMTHEFARFVRSAQGKHADYCSFILEDSWSILSCVRWMPWCCKGPSYKLTKLGFITACGLVRNAMNNTEKMKMWKWVIQSSTTLRCEFCRSIDLLNHLIHLENDYTARYRY